jgi:hypothetical protein
MIRAAEDMRANSHPHAATRNAGSCSQRDGSDDRLTECLVPATASIDFSPRRTAPRGAPAGA